MYVVFINIHFIALYVYHIFIVICFIIIYENISHNYLQLNQN